MDPPLAQHAKAQPAQNKQRDEQQLATIRPREARRLQTEEGPIQFEQSSSVTAIRSLAQRSLG